MNSIVLTVILVGVIGLIGSVILVIGSKAFHVEEDERLPVLVSILPGANCGSCGYPGCEGYARAMLEGEACNHCGPGGEKAAKALAEFLGVDAGEVTVKKALVACHGARDRKVSEEKESYKGTKSCQVFASMGHPTIACNNGCLGYGDCVATCPYGAIHITEDGVAEVNPEICIGCGLCTTVCPRHLIVLQERGKTDHPAFVLCKNTMMGKQARTACANVCLGCRKCEKTCPMGAVTVNNNVAHVDVSKCIGCGKCVEACPAGVINRVYLPLPKK